MIWYKLLIQETWCRLWSFAITIYFKLSWIRLKRKIISNSHNQTEDCNDNLPTKRDTMNTRLFAVTSKDLPSQLVQNSTHVLRESQVEIIFVGREGLIKINLPHSRPNKKAPTKYSGFRMEHSGLKLKNWTVGNPWKLYKENVQKWQSCHTITCVTEFMPVYKIFRTIKPEPNVHIQTVRATFPFSSSSLAMQKVK